MFSVVCDKCRVVVMFQIGNILDTYAATLTKRGDHDVFYMTTQGISQLVQRSVSFSDPSQFYKCQGRVRKCRSGDIWRIYVALIKSSVMNITQSKQ